MFGLLLACVASTKDADSAFPTESDADTDADADVDSDCSGPTTGTSPELPAETPAFSVEVGDRWVAETGYWVDLDGVSTVKGNLEIDNSTQEVVIVTVEGDVGVAGRYPVERVEFVRQLSASGDVFHYSTSEPTGLCLVVEGHAEEALFAHTEGQAGMSDPVAGYGAITMSALEVRAWPPY